MGFSKPCNDFRLMFALLQHFFGVRWPRWLKWCYCHVEWSGVAKFVAEPLEIVLLWASCNFYVISVTGVTAPLSCCQLRMKPRSWTWSCSGGSRNELRINLKTIIKLNKSLLYKISVFYLILRFVSVFVFEVYVIKSHFTKGLLCFVCVSSNDLLEGTSSFG